MFDIAVLGDKELEAKFKRLEQQTQKKVLSKAMRDRAKEAKKRISFAVSGAIVGVDSGRYRDAWRKAKVRVAQSRKDFLRLGVEIPSREDFGISPGDEWFYPYAIEYGYTRRGVHYPAKPHIRASIDAHITVDKRELAKAIGLGIANLFKK